MANDAIASGAAILTANQDGLVTGLDRAQKRIVDWGKGIGRQTQSLFSGLSDKVGDALGSALKPGKLLTGGALAAGATAAGSYLAHKVVDSISDTARQGQIADALGLTSEQFTGIAGVAKSVGEDTREFLESLVTMGKLGTDAAQGVGEVAGPVFEQLGLDAKEFIGLRADQQFFKMFEAITKVEDPLKRTRFLMNAFGEDGGKYLLPLLAKSPAKLKAMADGFAVSSDEMAKAQKANESFIALGASWDRAWRKLSVGVADDFGRMAQNLEKMVPAGKSIVENFLVPAADKAARLAEGISLAATAASRMPKEPADEAPIDAPKMESLGPDISWWGYIVEDYSRKMLNPFRRAFGFKERRTDLAEMFNEEALNAKFGEIGQVNWAPLLDAARGKAVGLADGIRAAWDNAVGLRDALKPGLGDAIVKEVAPGLALALRDAKGIADALESRRLVGEAQAAGLAFVGQVAPGLLRAAQDAGALAAAPWFLDRGKGWADLGRNLDPQFGGAYQRGSAEAYTLEMKNTFRDDGEQERADQQKITNRKLDVLSGHMGEIKRMLGAWPDEQETV